MRCCCFQVIHSANSLTLSYPLHSAKCDPLCESDEQCRRVDGDYKCVTKKSSPSRRSRRSRRACKHHDDCDDDEVCKRMWTRWGRYGKKRCVSTSRWRRWRKYYRKNYYHRSYDCDTKLKLVAVVANDDSEMDDCTDNLRFELDDFLKDDFEPERLDDLEVIDVDCTVDELKAELEDLVEDQDITDSKVKVGFVVLSEDTFENGSCDEDKLGNIQNKLEDKLNCYQIRRLEDFLTIEVGDSNECEANEVKKALLQEDFFAKED
jgi:hypothetical protein